MRTKLCLSAGLAVLVLTAWTTDARAGDCDALKLCYKDSLGNGTGVPIKWNMSCAIKYKVNVTLLDAAARATAVQAVQKAFAAYELPCTELKFQYAGLSTSHSDEKDAILVVFVDGQPLVLDNQNKQVVHASRIRHYRPIYSINDKNWWLHRG